MIEQRSCCDCDDDGNGCATAKPCNRIRAGRFFGKLFMIFAQANIFKPSYLIVYLHLDLAVIPCRSICLAFLVLITRNTAHTTFCFFRISSYDSLFCLAMFASITFAFEAFVSSCWPKVFFSAPCPPLLSCTKSHFNVDTKHISQLERNRGIA